MKWTLLLVSAYFTACTLLLLAYRWTFPPVTGVQIQRGIEALVAGRDYQRRYLPTRAEKISVHAFHAVVAAEDNRFFEHFGLDLSAIREAIEDDRPRGGSTITQQLAKNLFLTTHRSYVRKGVEVPLTLLAELLLSKDRILELYLNVVEWGDGLYGIEGASREYFGIASSQLTRRQSAALAACLPNPRARRPRVDGWYTGVILRRMRLLGY